MEDRTDYPKKRTAAQFTWENVCGNRLAGTKDF